MDLAFAAVSYSFWQALVVPSWRAAASNRAVSSSSSKASSAPANLLAFFFFAKSAVECCNDDDNPKVGREVNALHTERVESNSNAASAEILMVKRTTMLS